MSYRNRQPPASRPAAGGAHGAAHVLLAAALLALAAVAPIDRAVAAEPPGASAEAAPAATFDLLEFEVEGNSLLSTERIERTIYPMLGEQKTIRDVERAREALERAYHDAGYLSVLVDIPEQEVQGGLVRLRVVEASVDRLKITGSRYYSHGRIRAAAGELAEGNVPHFAELQEQVATLNRSADRKVTPVLRPGRLPGRIEAELKVEDKVPLHGGIELNNRSTPNTSATRLSANLRYDNLWQRDHSVGLAWQVSPQDASETRVVSGSYVLPVGRPERLLALYAVKSNSDVAAVGGVNVIGNGTIMGARYILSLPGRPGFAHTATLGIDDKDFEDQVRLVGADTSTTPIHYRPLLAQYGGIWVSERSETQFNLGANFAIRDLFGNDPVEFANKRFRADASYFYLRGDLQHTRTLESGWSWAGRADFQLAGEPLISNEQFGAGGAQSVRGYKESEVLGDRGWRLSLEVRTPKVAGLADGTIDELQGLAFVEGARLSVVDALPAQEDRFSLASAGLGLRLKAWRNVFSMIDLAWPLKATTNTPKGSARLGFRLGYEF